LNWLFCSNHLLRFSALIEIPIHLLIQKRLICNGRFQLQVQAALCKLALWFAAK